MGYLRGSHGYYEILLKGVQFDLLCDSQKVVIKGCNFRFDFDSEYNIVLPLKSKDTSSIFRFFDSVMCMYDPTFKGYYTCVKWFEDYRNGREFNGYARIHKLTERCKRYMTKRDRQIENIIFRSKL